MDVADLQKLLQKAWSKETSFEPDNWTPENPAWGQYAVTALVVQDFFGGEIILGAEIKTREDLLASADTKRRYAILRLAVENLIRPNPLLLHPIYQLCFKTALASDCKKMKFGCAVFYKSAWEEQFISFTANKIIEPLRHLCEPECIRLKIQSRTESMVGACCHAEEWALREIHRLRMSPELCSLYVAGFDAKTLNPWLKKETKEFSCLRCAVQLYMAGVGRIYVPAIDRWDAITPEEAVKNSFQYALGEKKI